MAEQQQDTTWVKKPKDKQMISRKFFTGVIAAVAVISFIAGTRGNEILGAVAPILGIQVETGTLDLANLQSTYQQLKANFDGELDEQALIDGAHRGLVEAAGDPYTTFMTAEEAAEFNNDLSGNIGGGIGAEIGLRNDAVTIIRVLPDNPAEEAGLEAGDQIIAVNDEPVGDETVDDVVGKIRGEVGTSVKISVLRDERRQDITVTRRTVTNPSVQSRIENNIGILTLSRFDEQTSRLAREAAQSFKRENVRGVVLDLRGNGGGYLTAAQEVAGIWLNNKVVVTERSGGQVTEELKTGNDAILNGVPTTILVNGGSASASEIVAGALQDHGAATLIGEKTFGKGSVQKIIELSNGNQLKVTIAKWYTPKGKNITESGIEPDQIIELTQEDVNAGDDPQLDAALDRLRR